MNVVSQSVDTLEIEKEWKKKRSKLYDQVHSITIENSKV